MLTNSFIRKPTFWSRVVAMFLLCGGTRAVHAQDLGPSYAQTLTDIEQLPHLRAVARVGSFSSYDRSGGDDKGFSGRYSFLRKEGDGLVIAEVSGPGAVTRIWTATPTDDPIEFYFDSETIPRLVLPFRRLFSGGTQPFVGALTGHGAGGYYCNVPLEFAKSVKIVVRAEVFHFYQVNYVVYEPTIPVRTFTPGDTFQLSPARYDGENVKRNLVLPAGKTVTLFETTKPGRIQSLSLGPADAFAGKDRGIVLRIYWDDAKRPAVEVPVGDFFGYSFGRPATHSLMLGTENGWNYIHFPMPFERAARIELTSECSGGEPLSVQSEMVISGRGKMPDEGTFHAEWRRENPTMDGRPFTYLDVAGRGTMVAAILQAQGREPGQTFFFEGIDEASIDGEVTIHGTGTEDMFNGGWYDIPGRWTGRESLPLSGCLEYNKAIARTGGYRFFVPDAYTFHHSLRYTVDHGGRDNKTITDYVGTVFYYLDRPEGNSAPLPNVAARTVIDPSSFVLKFWPSPPPISALLSASLDLSGKRIGKEWVNFASFRRNISAYLQPPPPGTPAGQLKNDMFPREDCNNFDWMFGPPVLVLSVDVRKAGDYAISIEGLTGPSSAFLQLRVNDEPAGNTVDFFRPKPGKSGPQKLADLSLKEGKNLLYLTLPGKNANSTGEGVDIIEIRGDLLR